MTITEYDKYSILPTRCDKCGRLFIFEPYDIYYKEVGFGHDLKYVVCRECISHNENRKKDNNNDNL